MRFVVGIDAGGTSREVLEELLSWSVDVRIVKHRHPGHMFHPKIYLFEWTDRRIVIVGSNNLTDGGLFRNYEGAAQITYASPEDDAEFSSATLALERFLEPSGPTAYRLTREWLAQAVKSGHVPTEAEARERRRKSTRPVTSDSAAPLELGSEEFNLPPPLPADMLDQLLTHVRARRRAARKKARINESAISDQEQSDESPAAYTLSASAFYMTLPKLQGKNIPGEARVPLAAVEIAQEFWGWPDEYTKQTSPHGGTSRVYWNWKPRWRIRTVGSTVAVSSLAVRMYMYENSSDFRFYARPLVNAGADEGDVVRIRRLAEPDVEYECVLAKRNTVAWQQWVSRCTQSVSNSNRRFGYA